MGATLLTVIAHGTGILPLSYDDIEKGRRRNWDGLKDPDEKKRELEVEREKDPDYQKRKSAMRNRDDNRETRREREIEEWQQTKKQLIRWGAIAGVIIACYIVGTGTWSYFAEKRRLSKIEELEVLVDSGRPFLSLKDPMEAFASWRSVWQRQNATDLYRISSSRLQKSNRGEQSDQKYIRDLQQQMTRGNNKVAQTVAAEFRDPILLQLPKAPWRDQQLAVFKSQPLQYDTNQKATSWIAAFCWEGSVDEWRLCEFRRADAWQDSWYNANQINASRIARQKGLD